MSEPSASCTPPSLLLRIRNARDAEAWQTFVDLYGPLIYHQARRLALQSADAADVTQEVLVEVARCIRNFTYQPERGRFRDWLATLTRRKLARFFTRKNRVVGEAGTAEGDGALEDCEERADPEWTAEFNARVLRAALERARPHFTPANWQAFELVWLENRPAAEVAREVGLALEVVYVAKSRVLKRLEEEVRLLAEDVPGFVPLR